MNENFHDKFTKVINKMEESGNAYADAKGKSYQMQELRSSVLSKLIKSQGEIPVSKAEIIAKASPEYEEYIQETGKAITEELRAKAELEKWKCSFEALRSLCSLDKATQKEIGY